LPASASINLTVKGGIESIYGQTLGSDQNYGYTVSATASVCALDGVEIFPGSWYSTVENASKTFYARAYSRTSQGVTYIIPTAGYSWTWTWQEDDPGNLINMAPAGDTNVITTPTRGQGTALATASAQVDVDLVFAGSHLGRERSNYVEIRIFICDYPWPDPPAR